MNNEPAELLEILNLHQLEPEFGADLQSNVADSFSKLATTVLPKEKFDEMKKKLLTPQNCKQLGVPRVNQEIWTVLSPRAKQVDYQSQQMQCILSSSTVALAQLAEKIMQNSKKLPTELSQDLLKLAVQAATFNSKLSQDINLKRKQDIKPCLSSDIMAVCNTPSTPDFLFGDNVCETIKATKTAAAVMRPSIVRRGNTRPYYGRPYSTYFSPRTPSLNFNRASFPSYRGGPRQNYRSQYSQRGSMLRPQQRQNYRPQQ